MKTLSFMKKTQLSDVTWRILDRLLLPNGGRYLWMVVEENRLDNCSLYLEVYFSVIDRIIIC